MTKTKECRWKILKTRPKKEQIAMAHLEELVMDYYFPLVRDFKIINNKKEIVLKPLFTGYLFVKDQDKVPTAKLQFIRGTTGLLTFDRKNVSVSDLEIDVLKKVCKLKSAPEVVSEIAIGELIIIKNGPLKGVTGVVSKIMDKQYIFIESGINGMLIKIKLEKIIIEKTLSINKTV